MEKKPLPMAFAYLLLVIRAMIFGSTVLFTSRLLQTTDFLDVLALRFLFAAIAFLIPAAAGLIRVSYKNKSLRLLAAAAMLEPVGYFLLETLGIRGTSTLLAGILSAVSPVIVVLLETLLLHERTSLQQKLLLGAGIAGVLIITLSSGGDSGKNSLSGVLLLLLAYTSSGLFLICSRRCSRQFSAVEITFFTTLTGAAVFNGVNLIRHAGTGTLPAYFVPLQNPQNLIGLLFLGVMASGIATIINNYGVSRLQVSSVAALGGVSPLTCVLLGVFIDHNPLHGYHAAGGILILAGAVGVNLLSIRRQEKAAGITKR